MDKIDLINRDSGEVIGEYLPKSKKIRRPVHYFFLIFFEGIDKLPIKIIGEMDNRNIFVLDGKTTKRFDAMGYKYNALRQALHRMVADGDALRVGVGRYFINPFRYTKSKRKDIDKLRTEYKDISFEMSMKKEKRKADAVERAKNILRKASKGKNLDDE